VHVQPMNRANLRLHIPTALSLSHRILLLRDIGESMLNSFRALASTAVILALSAGCTTAESVGTEVVAAGTATAPLAVPVIARQALFGNPSRTAGQISTDGRYVSWMAPLNGVMNIWVAPADNPNDARAITRETGRPPASYFWAPDSSTILFVQDAGGNENYRLYAVDVTTAEKRALTEERPNVRTQIQGVSRLRPDVVLIGINDRNPQLFDLYEVNYRTGEKRLIEQNPGFAAYVTDRMLQPRFGIRVVPGSATMYSRRTAEGQWEDGFTVPAEDDITTRIIGFDRSGQTLWMLDSRDRNTAALVRWNLATDNREVVAENDRADIAGLLFDPQTYDPLAYSFNYLKNEWTPLDDGFAADLEFLRSRLPGELSFAGGTTDRSKVLVLASSAEAPATYYIYDRNARTVAKMFETRPELAEAPLQPMHPVVIQSRDGKNLVSYLTLPPGTDVDATGRPKRPVPMVLGVHGGPWARDSYGYSEFHQWLANRGYAVLSVNFRGSTGFGKDFVNAAVGEWAGAMHDDLIDGVDWAISRGITRQDQVGIFGGSYGGYAALVGLTFTPDRFACGASLVGPSNIATMIESFPPYWRPMLENTMYRHVGDPADPKQRARMLEQSPITRVDQIRKPLLILQGANDPRVVKAESDQIVEAMKARNLPVTYLLYPDEGHGFARPENTLSATAVMEGFFAQCLSGRYEPIGDDFRGSSIQVLEGAHLVPGLSQAIAGRTP
jgi:dipeptidyl aminopeptidase/acylaminoacyl peptidase